MLSPFFDADFIVKLLPQSVLVLADELRKTAAARLCIEKEIYRQEYC